jgi:hypothetical protein
VARTIVAMERASLRVRGDVTQYSQVLPADPRRDCVFCAEWPVPRLYKGDRLKEQQSQENGNTMAYNGVQQEKRKRELESVIDRSTKEYKDENGAFSSDL